MTHTMKLTGIVLVLALLALPGCGAAALLAPLIEAGVDEIFNNDQKGDQIPDNTAIGEAVELAIALGGRFCCDAANGTDQRVTIVTIRHTGSGDSDPITYQFVPNDGTKLSATPANGTLAPGEVATISIHADDCDFFVEEFRMRTFFVGEQGVPGRSTTAVLSVRNVCDTDEPTVDAFVKLLGDPSVQATLADRIALVNFGEAVSHGDVSVPDRIPDIPLSQISYYGSLELDLDAADLEAAFTGAGAVFAEGTHSNGSVYAAETPAPMPEGGYSVVFFGVDGAFDLIDGSRQWRFAVAVDSDGQAGNNFVPDAQHANDPYQGTDRRYVLDFAPGSGWRARLLDSAGAELASAVRVVRVTDALLFIVPKAELPGPGAGYRVVTFTHTGDNGLGASHDWSGDHHPTPGLAALGSDPD